METKQESQTEVRQKDCTFCGEQILEVAKKCKHCGEFCTDSMSGVTKNTAEIVRDGLISFNGTYENSLGIVERAMSDCDVKIKERSIENGLLVGKCKYGINPFGITVTAVFHSDGGAVNCEISAELTDSFDTMGVTKKKVSQITDRVRALSGTWSGHTKPSNQNDSETSYAAPAYSERSEPNLKGKAVTGFVLSLLGLFFVPTAFVSAIMCGFVLKKMSNSSNKSGEGLAIAGIVISFIDILWWMYYLI